MNESDLEKLWDRLLSRQPELVLKAFRTLKSQDREAVMDHLRRMASEPGWHPEQVKSARVALDALSGAQDEGD